MAPTTLSCLGLDLSGKRLNNKGFFLTSLLFKAKRDALAKLAYFIYLKFDSLKEFSLVGLSGIKPGSNLLKFFSPCFANLNKLNLNLFISTSWVTESVQRHIASIKELKINCYKLQDSTICKIIHAAQELKCLYFTSWSVERILERQGLTSEVTDLKVENFFIKLRKKQLDPKESNKPRRVIADERVFFNLSKFLANHTWLLKSMPDLKYLEIRGIDKLSDKSTFLITARENVSSSLHVRLIHTSGTLLSNINLNKNETTSLKNNE